MPMSAFVAQLTKAAAAVPLARTLSGNTSLSYTHTTGPHVAANTAVNAQMETTAAHDSAASARDSSGALPLAASSGGSSDTKVATEAWKHAMPAAPQRSSSRRPTVGTCGQRGAARAWEGSIRV